jgi:hypothetical protein
LSYIQNKATATFKAFKIDFCKYINRYCVLRKPSSRAKQDEFSLFIMPNLTTLLLGLCIVLFIGCSKDEEDFLTPLVGTWETSEIITTGCSDPADNGSLSCTGGPCFVVTINSNSTYTLQNNVDQTSEAGTVSVTATTINLCETGDTGCEAQNYSLSGDKLTITFTEDDSPGCLFTIVFTKK